MEGRGNEGPKGTSTDASTTTITPPSRHRRNRTVDLGNQVIPASPSPQTITPVVARLRSRTGAAETSRTHPLYSAYGNDDPSPTFSRASIGEQRLNPSYHEPGVDITRSGTPAPFINRGVDLNRPSDRDYLSQRNLSLPARDENVEAFPSFSDILSTSATTTASARSRSPTPGQAQLPAYNLHASQAAYLQATANSSRRDEETPQRNQTTPEGGSRALRRRDSNQLVGRLRLPETTPGGTSLRDQFQRSVLDNEPLTPIANAQATRQSSSTQSTALRHQHNRRGTLSGDSVALNSFATSGTALSAPGTRSATTTAIPQGLAAATIAKFPSNTPPITSRGRATTRNRAETFLNAERPDIQALLTRTAPGTTPAAAAPGPARSRSRRESEKP